MTQWKVLGPLALLLAASTGMAWTPQPPFDVDKILKEAREDAEAGRLQDAADRYRWYHANALTYKPSHTGVRLSFALSYWHELALRHPPAMKDMLDAQAKAVQLVRAGGPDASHAMHEVGSFAERLSDPRPMAELFAWLDANRPADARRFADEALPSLVTANQIALAVRYLDLADTLAGHERRFKSLSQHIPSNEDKERVRRSWQDFVDRDAAFAVAALVKAGRPADAQKLVDGLRPVLGAEARMHATSDALRGHAPPLRRY